MYSNWSNSPSPLAIHISSLDIMRVVAEKLGPIGSAILTFIGDKQTSKVYTLYSDNQKTMEQEDDF